MDAEIIKNLLDVDNRSLLFNEILNKLEDYGKLDLVHYQSFKINNDLIPLIKIPKFMELDDVLYVKIFVGAQHNEYNGLFGTLQFLENLKLHKFSTKELIKENQLLMFFPLMNPHGFLYPSMDNKSGYYLKNGTNLNRYWRQLFAPEYENKKRELKVFPIPEQAQILKQQLEKYWKKDHISMYFLDFHETSLLYKHLADLSLNLKEKSITYKFDHWLKEMIVKNIMNLYGIKWYRKPLFYKCKSDADHKHARLSMKQIDLIYEKLQEYMVANRDKLPFYFCHSQRSKSFCQKLAKNVYEKLRDTLWETSYPSVDHHHDHGCLVMMNDATKRPNVYSMELENQKHFFNIFEEIEKSKLYPDYYQRKLKSINRSVKLVVQTISEMIKLF